MMTENGQPQYGIRRQCLCAAVRKPQRRFSAKSRTVFWVFSGFCDWRVVFVTVVSILWLLCEWGATVQEVQGKSPWPIRHQ
jgi:hypothetical protein